jgi:prefoldin subunit 5
MSGKTQHSADEARLEERITALETLMKSLQQSLDILDKRISRLERFEDEITRAAMGT